MVKALFVRNLKTIYKPWIIFSAILTMYITVIIGMFDPALGESLNQMMESMPQLFSAFGMNAPGSTLLDFMANYLYGFLLICLPRLDGVAVVQPKQQDQNLPDPGAHTGGIGRAADGLCSGNLDVLCTDSVP